MVCTYNQCSIYQDCVKRLDEDVTRDECEYFKKYLVGPFENTPVQFHLTAKRNNQTLLSRGPQADLFSGGGWQQHIDMMIKTKHLMEVAAEHMGRVTYNKDIPATCDCKPFDYEEFDRVTRDLKNRFANRELMSKASNETLVELIIAIIVEYKERADHSEDKAHLMKYLKARVNNAIDIKE